MRYVIKITNENKEIGLKSQIKKEEGQIEDSVVMIDGCS